MLLALDISTRTGWSLFSGDHPVAFGLIEKTIGWQDHPFPFNFVAICEEMSNKICGLIQKYPDIDKIVIEMTNKPGSKGSRFSQMALDGIHIMLNARLRHIYHIKVYYINSSDWRKKLGLSVAEAKKQAKPFLKELKALETKLQSASKSDRSKIQKEIKEMRASLRARCILGKIDKKSISVAFCNATWSLALKKGDDNQADALCQGRAFLMGCKVITNDDVFNRGN